MAKDLVRQKQVELEAAIVACGDVRLLANEMNAAGLMANNVHAEITAVGGTWWTDEQRAGSIVRILRNKVNIKPSNLEKFKSILKSKSEFEDILDVLEATAAGSEPTKYRATTQGSQPSSSDHSPALPGGDLTLVNIKIFLKEEDFHANRAEELGVYLGIKPGRIAALKQISGGDPDRLLSSIITEWLDNDKEKSWQKLATALRHCHHSLIANKIPPQEELKPSKHRANTQPSSSDHSTELPEGLIRRPQRSWQDRIPDTHLSNEERETIREHEDPVPLPSEKPKERYKFKDKRILCGFVVVMIILAGGFLYIMLNTNATTDKEYTPVLIICYKDVKNVLKKVNPKRVTYEEMCRDLLKEETCNELIGKNELDVDNIAMYYFRQHQSLYWHDLISILCNQFGENHLAGEVAKEHGVPYEKYCPTT